jgi:hypothetical protein
LVAVVDLHDVYVEAKVVHRGEVLEDVVVGYLPEVLVPGTPDGGGLLGQCHTSRGGESLSPPAKRVFNGVRAGVGGDQHRPVGRHGHL